jgi:aspartyl-tRNA synthetase
MMKRTNTCGELRKEHIGKEVVLNGWVSTCRDHGGIIFIDLRDRFGITQIVFDPKEDGDSHNLAEKLRREDVVGVSGKVRKRLEGMENHNLETGEIEVVINKVEVFSKAATPPIEVDDRVNINDEIRLRYRYLDLRRPKVIKNLVKRHKIINAGREYFNKMGFLEVTTPMLVKSTPEGARDYVVPSRMSPGKFYALPQSPQLYKQILMVAGFDRYYQVATCLRDEDLRADRQPEHGQFDFEMSFVSSDDIRDFVNGLFKHIFKQVEGIDLPDFPIFSYEEAIDKYGTDKPDIRYDLFLKDVTEIMKNSEFSVFKDVIKDGGVIKCINPEKDFGRAEVDGYIKFCQENGSKGMAWMKVTDSGLDSNIVKYFPKEVQDDIIKATGAKPGSTLMFIADKKKACNDIISRLRQKVAKDLKLYDEKEFRFCWVKDFPLFAYNEDEERWEPEHHMFSMPKPEFVDDFEKRPGEVIGDLWDLVLNGVELGSGSVRVSNPKVQERIMKLIGLSLEEANRKFGFLLEAYKYGGPPHGGMGLGIDRIIALMCGTNDIREVIAFPKNKNAECPMDGCPSEIDESQLKELHVKTDIIKVGARGFLSVSSTAVTDYLDEQDIMYKKQPHSKSVHSVNEIAKERNVKPDEIARVMVLTDGGDYFMAIVPGNKDVNLKKTAAAFGKEKLEPATKEQILNVTGYPMDAVSPFLQKKKLPAVVDKAFTFYKQCSFSSGDPSLGIMMECKKLIEMLDAKVESVSK